MTKTTQKRTLFLYPNEEQIARIDAAYATSQQAWKRNKTGQLRPKSLSEYLLYLITVALDRDAAFEGSRVALAGHYGKAVSAQLDSQLLLLRALIDLLCLASHISDEQKNEAILRAAMDPNFGSRLADLRAYYLAHMAPPPPRTGPETEES